MVKGISNADLQRYQEDYANFPSSHVIARAVQKNGVVAASENYAEKKNLNRTYSIEVETGKVCNQQKSGRCWLFATLNTLRQTFSAKYQIKDFQFSQNYNSFYDRLEKANKFYENIIATANLPLQDRYVQQILAWGDNDGGQWANAAAIITKYGLVPQYVMEETYNSNKTDEINATLNWKLKEDAIAIRKLISNGASEAEVEEHKQKLMSEVYRMLVYAFGKPPVKFDFEYRDDKKEYHIDKDLTPVSFFKKYVDVDFHDYVCLTDAPDHELGKLYGLPSQDYMPDGQKIEFLISTTQDLKDAAIAQLKDGQTVWLGCDVLEDMDRKQGILASEYFKQADLFGLDLAFSKKDRLETRQATVSHAMTFTGVDIVDGQSTKWKVENSWGDKIGDKGYFIMTDQWFDKFMYEVVVNKKYLKPEQLALLDQPVIELKPWDSLQ